MDKEEIKRKLLNSTILENISKDELLKKNNIIDEYKINTSIENLKLNKNGSFEYDIVIHHKITPKTSVEDVINFEKFK